MEIATQTHLVLRPMVGFNEVSQRPVCGRQSTDRSWSSRLQDETDFATYKLLVNTLAPYPPNPLRVAGCDALVGDRPTLL